MFSWNTYNMLAVCKFWSKSIDFLFPWGGWLDKEWPIDSPFQPSEILVVYLDHDTLSVLHEERRDENEEDVVEEQSGEQACTDLQARQTQYLYSVKCTVIYSSQIFRIVTSRLLDGKWRAVRKIRQMFSEKVSKQWKAHKFEFNPSPSNSIPKAL